jgi:Holliday junction resolvase RusA-like endonuclease
MRCYASAMRACGKLQWYTEVVKTLIIPISPLSVNQAWRGRRFRSKDYVAYEKHLAMLLIKDRYQKPIEGKLELHYRFYFKNCKKRDFDNAIKPITDILVKFGIIADDRFIYKATIEKIPSKEDRVEIDIHIIE